MGRSAVSGFTAVLHTWNQKLQFHPHLHFLVPGAGLDEKGQAVRVKYSKFLVVRGKLQVAFRKQKQSHPVAKANRMRVKFNTGMKVQLGVLLEKKTSGEGVAKCTNLSRFEYNILLRSNRKD